MKERRIDQCWAAYRWTPTGVVTSQVDIIGDSFLEHIGNSPGSDRIGLSFVRAGVQLSGFGPVGLIVVAERRFRVPRRANTLVQKRGVRIKSRVVNDPHQA